jgi:hypothetical protein
MVCVEHTIGSEIIFTHSRILVGDEAQVDARFGLYGDTANLDARYVHGLRQTYHRLRSHFGRTRWISYMTLVMWNVVLIHLEIVVE